MRKDILVVEYNSDIIDTINEFLRHEIFDITNAGDSIVAKAVLAKKKFDMVITASLLPKSHGFTLAKFIREKYPKIKIIIICDKFGAEEYQKEGYDSGACEIFEKPLKESDFRQKVMDHLGLKPDTLFSEKSTDSTRIHVLPLLDDLKSVPKKSASDKKSQHDDFDDIIKDVQDDSISYEIKLD